MRKFAQLNSDNIVISIAESERNIPGDGVIEITDSSDPMGKKWDGSAFIDVTPPQPEPITNITKFAFMQRMTQAERIAFRASTDPIIIDIRGTLELSRYIDLKLQVFEDSINYLITKSIIQAARKPDLIKDGTEAEKYRGMI